jgi:hypothetical protein
MNGNAERKTKFVKYSYRGKRGETVSYFDSEKRPIGNAMMTESEKSEASTACSI